MRPYTIILIIVFIGTQLWAQEQKTDLKKTINSYERQNDVKISFDPELIELINYSFDTTLSIQAFANHLSENFPFAMADLGGDFYSIKAVERLYVISIEDHMDSNAPSISNPVILLNGEPIASEVIDQKVQFRYTPNLKQIIEVFSLGYNKKTIELEKLVNDDEIIVQLNSPLLKLSEVTIEDYLTKGIALKPSKQNIKIAIKDMPLLPGETDGDIFASIASLPGITTPDGRAGNLIIRGSETDQSMVLYDNIPIYHRGHYYGTISPYNPKTVEHVEVYRNGFHPRLGGRVGGAVVINSENDFRSESMSGLGINTLFGMGYTKIPVNEKLSISLGARHSLPEDYQSPKLVTISESVFDGSGLVDDNGDLTGEAQAKFEDYHAKINLRLNDGNKLSLSTMYTYNQVNSKIEQTSVVPVQRDESSFRNFGANLDWIYNISDTWHSKMSVTVANYQYQFTTFNPSEVPVYVAGNELKDLNIRQEFSNRNNQNLWIQTGVDYKWQEAIMDYRTGGTAPDFQLVEAKSSHSISPFGNLEYHGFENWYLQLGLRATYFSLLNDFRAAPRLLINFEPKPWMTVKSSFGTYNQYLSQVKNLEFGGGGFDDELWTIADNERGHIINGQQAMLGVILHEGTFLFDVEYFYKTANDITNYEVRRLNVSSDYFTMDQSTSGIDLLLKKEVTKSMALWAGYSYTESKITLDTTDATSYKSKYVQPNVWNIGGAINRNQWKISAVWKHASGLNANSLDIVHAEFLRTNMNAQNGDRPPISNPFENRAERYASSHSLDLSVSYRLPKNERRNWSASLGLSIINLYNEEILVDQVFRGQKGFRDRYAQGFSPNLMLIFEF